MLRLLPQITPGFGYRCPPPTDSLVIVKGNLGMSLLVMRVQHAQHDSGRGFAQGPHKSRRQTKCDSAPFQCLYLGGAQPTFCAAQAPIPAFSLHSRHPTDRPAPLPQRTVDKQLRERQVPDMRHSHPEWNPENINFACKIWSPPFHGVFGAAHRLCWRGCPFCSALSPVS